MAKKPSNALILKRIDEHGGIIKTIAESFGVSRQAMYNWINKNPKLKEAHLNSREIFIDTAEEGLFELVKAKNERAVVYALSTLGKRRGYTQLIETRDRTKFDDALQDMSEEDLLELLEKTTKRISDG